MLYDVIIIGAGAAGLSAAIYAGRYRMKILVLGKDFGGAAATAGKIENYPGFSSIDGYELMNLMKKQTEELGVEFLDQEVNRIKQQNQSFEVSVNEIKYQAKTIKDPKLPNKVKAKRPTTILKLSFFQFNSRRRLFISSTAFSFIIRQCHLRLNKN